MVARGGTARDTCRLTTKLRNRAIWLSSISASGALGMLINRFEDEIILVYR